MLNELLNKLAPKDPPLDHLDDISGVFHNYYKHKPRTNVRIRVGVFAGGGSKGLVALQMAKGIEDKIKEENEKRIAAGKKPIEQSFIDTLDVMSGTSTGAIISSLLALRKSTDPKSKDFKKPKYSVEDIIEKYGEYLPEIFGASKLNVVQAAIPPWSREKVKAIAHSGGRYSNIGLKELLEEEFGDLKFNEDNFLIPIHIPVLDLTNDKSIIFRSSDNLNNKVVDVLLATSAASPILPVHKAKFQFFDKNEDIITQEITAADGFYYANSLDAEVVDYYSELDGNGVRKHNVRKRSLKHCLDKDIDICFTITEFGTGELSKKTSQNLSRKTTVGWFAAAAKRLANSGRMRDHLRASFNLSNRKSGKDEQYSDKHIYLNAKLKSKASVSAHSKKALLALNEAGKRAVKVSAEEINEYVVGSFSEHLLRKCDRRMQMHVKTAEFRAWLKKQTTNVANLDAENRLLLHTSVDRNNAHSANKAQRILSELEHKKHDLPRFKYIPVNKKGECKQREIKGFLHHNVYEPKSRLTSACDWQHRQNAFATQGCSELFYSLALKPGLSNESSKNAITIGEQNFEIVRSGGFQRSLYLKFFKKILDETPDNIPKLDAGPTEKVAFTRTLIRGLNIERSNKPCYNKYPLMIISTPQW